MYPYPDKKSKFLTFFIFDPMVAQVKMIKCLIPLDTHYLHLRTFLISSCKRKIFLQSLVAKNTFLASESPNPKNSTWTAITQQWIVQFTQTKQQNLPLNILFSLLDSNNIQNIKKMFEKII